MDGQAVDNASQKRCVVLFASEDKKRQAKLLPGMTKAGEMGLCVLTGSASLTRGLCLPVLHHPEACLPVCLPAQRPASQSSSMTVVIPPCPM